MVKAFEPCIPTRGTKVPTGRDWLHEIKHDGYRLIVQREGSRVRLFTRNGHDWTDRYPLIVEAALKNRKNSFVIDGEAVLLGVDGISDFIGLHSRRHDDEVQLYAFDILTTEGDDLRKLPLSLRKTNLARLLAGVGTVSLLLPSKPARSTRICSARPASSGWREMVSKRKDSHYRAGRSPNWVKVKNRKHQAMSRVRETIKAELGRRPET
jgi:bifunctional non-homologous end joining protein LigD